MEQNGGLKHVSCDVTESAWRLLKAEQKRQRNQVAHHVALGGILSAVIEAQLRPVHSEKRVQRTRPKAA